MAQVTFADFQKVDIRVGRVTRVDEFPAARNPSYKLWIDFGPELGVKTSGAQLTKIYRKEDLIGRLVMAVTNFPPRQIADFNSEVLTLGFVLPDAEGVVLALPERDVPLGSKLA